MAIVLVLGLVAMFSSRGAWTQPGAAAAHDGAKDSRELETDPLRVLVLQSTR